MNRETTTKAFEKHNLCCQPTYLNLSIGYSQASVKLED